jgi:heme exporter protein CcmD
MSESHGTFIVLAYGVTFAVIGGVALRIILEHHRLRAELARLEQTGAKEESEEVS